MNPYRILLDYKKKVIFLNTGKGYAYGYVPAKKEEIEVFEAEFLNIGIRKASFKDFKAACIKHKVPFNGNKKKDRVYGTINLTEWQYIDIENLRNKLSEPEFKEKYKSIYLRSYSDIIDFALYTLKNELLNENETRKHCTDDCKFKQYVNLQKEIFHHDN